MGVRFLGEEGEGVEGRVEGSTNQGREESREGGEVRKVRWRVGRGARSDETGRRQVEPRRRSELSIRVERERRRIAG
jgi:hypothetical protein